MHFATHFGSGLENVFNVSFRCEGKRKVIFPHVFNQLLFLASKIMK